MQDNKLNLSISRIPTLSQRKADSIEWGIKPK